MNIKKVCPLCGQPLQEGDDIVVCPDCGTPHHRACWKAHGQCGCPEQHISATPVQAEPESPAAPAENSSADAADAAHVLQTNICPYCRTDNDADARFCHQCGHPLLHPQDLPGMRIVSDPLGGIDPDEPIGGVSAKDLADVVGPKSPQYLRIFHILNKVKRAFPLNLSALLFDIPWLFTRKMYLPAIGVTLLELALSAPTVWAVIVTAIAGEALQFSGSFWFLYHACNVLQWVLRIALGLFGNRLYMNHCVEKVRQLRKKYPDDDSFRAAARKKGGRSAFFMYTTGALTVLYLLFTMWSGILL